MLSITLVWVNRLAPNPCILFPRFFIGPSLWTITSIMFDWMSFPTDLELSPRSVKFAFREAIFFSVESIAAAISSCLDFHILLSEPLRASSASEPPFNSSFKYCCSAANSVSLLAISSWMPAILYPYSWPKLPEFSFIAFRSISLWRSSSSFISFRASLFFRTAFP